jgi:toxin ParE1/3/4
MSSRWRVRIAVRAEQDLIGILRWTRDNFGTRQAGLYREAILASMRELEHGPDIEGARDRGDVAAGLKSIRVARRGRRGSHVVFFRSRDGVIEIVRILHEAMDFARHFEERR